MHELVERTSVAVLIPLAASAILLRAVRAIVLDAYPGAIAYGALLVLGLAGVSWVGYTRLSTARASASAG